MRLLFADYSLLTVIAYHHKIYVTGCKTVAPELPLKLLTGKRDLQKPMLVYGAVVDDDVKNAFFLYTDACLLARWDVGACFWNNGDLAILLKYRVKDIVNINVTALPKLTDKLVKRDACAHHLTAA